MSYSKPSEPVNQLGSIFLMKRLDSYDEGTCVSGGTYVGGSTCVSGGTIGYPSGYPCGGSSGCPSGYPLGDVIDCAYVTGIPPPTNIVESPAISIVIITSFVIVIFFTILIKGLNNIKEFKSIF